jgi:hypothetical protein
MDNTCRSFLSALIPGLVAARGAPADSRSDMAERFRQMSEKAERKGLAQPFKGITTKGDVIPGLFAI